MSESDPAVLFFNWDFIVITDYLSDLTPDTGREYLADLEAKLDAEISAAPGDPEPRRRKRELQELAGWYGRYLQSPEWKRGALSFSRWLRMNSRPSPPRSEAQVSAGLRVRESIERILVVPLESTDIPSQDKDQTKNHAIAWQGTAAELLALLDVLRTSGLVTHGTWKHAAAVISSGFTKAGGAAWSRRGVGRLKTEEYRDRRASLAGDILDRIVGAVEQITKAPDEFADDGDAYLD